ncbi:MAG TPA: argininosuccinate lyase [Syntrophothermus lipocalidus]|uniref:Argininosuccinate lyase n=1 Tax=Syntrophothermus lipocalidus (strain DSM 12680 / TGB-C1) TaxID=643648 RepID=D7CJ35_SYNLT|nr:argininosuccinate lyase [Syntrophothermus lipocalidus DSM 12680]HHV77312.1 argininosuccinate lyase [Syntrophothermus lipocalidus]
MSSKMWGGRFQKPPHRLTEEFNASLSFDRRLYRQDIKGSMAHAAMLAKQGLITEEEKELIIKALQEIMSALDRGELQFDPGVEDIHTQVELWLIERIGTTGKKLHTGRSRNDQVALDVRMYLKEEIGEIRELLLDLEETLVSLAEEHLYTIMPGYTHLQKGQPVTLAHHLMAYFEMFWRDLGRLEDCKKRLDFMPLGSGALAGSGLDLDREYVREQLGFAELTRNSLDAVSDRDFALEFLSFASITMMHLSRFCEELVLWSTDEFKFVEMDDAFATGSSLMPQKKNPDVAELIRGKTGRVYGDLMCLFTVMKGLPLAYNKDMQEDKEPLFDGIDTLKKCLAVFTPMLRTAKFNRQRMAEATRGGFTNATDMADYLVVKGIPFRVAHEIAGRAVLYCIEKNKTLESMGLEELKQFSPEIEDDVYDRISLNGCVASRKVKGGTAPEAVRDAILEANKLLSEFGRVRVSGGSLSGDEEGEDWEQDGEEPLKPKEPEAGFSDESWRYEIDEWVEGFFHSLVSMLNAFTAEQPPEEVLATLEIVPFGQLVREQLSDREEELIEYAVEKVNQLHQAELERLKAYLGGE